jgi:hypothetical protein
MLVVSGRFKDESDGEVRTVRRTALQIAVYSRKWKSYSYTTICKKATRAFSSVGHRYAERDIEASWGTWLANDESHVFLDLGFVGDAVAALHSTALIRLQGRASPLLRAVAAPSTRVSLSGSNNWRSPDASSCDHLNSGQLAALQAFRHNLEAVTGPPGTGKSTLISAIVTECTPKKESTIVSAVQNRAIEVKSLHPHPTVPTTLP